jgi:hypothetical protein
MGFDVEEFDGTVEGKMDQSEGEIVGDRMSCCKYNVSSRRRIYICFSSSEQA